ncbi:MAG: ATP-binding cassette domain-containing protein [Bacteroidales bacterium]|nr:ATP-binding cassette domain-containing protein [Bacteroidales bacterium]
MEDGLVIGFKEASISQKNKLVLSGVNLKLGRGEFVYLIGKTGSGKSSLLQTIYAGIPVRGEVASVCGYDLKTIKKRQIPFLRRKLGIVFQDYQLLSDRSIQENLKFVLKATGWKDKAAISERILEVLSEVGLIAKLNAMPHQLSGGEQQRVAIARAILNKPELILADEPTGNLDPATSNEVMRILNKICEDGTAVLMATHNYNLIQKFPGRIEKCGEGTVVSSGNHEN